jgi:hypothetical protein
MFSQLRNESFLNRNASFLNEDCRLNNSDRRIRNCRLTGLSVSGYLSLTRKVYNHRNNSEPGTHDVNPNTYPQSEIKPA